MGNVFVCLHSMEKGNKIAYYAKKIAQNTMKKTTAANVCQDSYRWEVSAGGLHLEHDLEGIIIKENTYKFYKVKIIKNLRTNSHFY